MVKDMDLSLTSRKQLRGVYFKKSFVYKLCQLSQILRSIFVTFIYILNRKKTWRDDALSGVKRKSNTTDGLPSKRMVSTEYSRYV